jgi:hypothetical protein
VKLGSQNQAEEVAVFALSLAQFTIRDKLPWGFREPSLRYQQGQVKLAHQLGPYS